MKNPVTKALLLGSLGFVAAILQSCVTPYVETGGPVGSVTTYQAGYETRSLPRGYRTEVIGDESYYTHNGTYYRRGSGGYVVVEAPTRTRGYDRGGRSQGVIMELPRGYRTINHNGGRYYQDNDVYYQQRGEGYVIVRSPF